ncbi:MAG: ClpX C4-type zinc finger protein [Myxococcaceae bacterium]
MDPLRPLRDLLRTAQEAEIHGDVTRAASLLREAADQCANAGRTHRAEQLERHAERLVPKPAGVKAEATSSGATLAPLAGEVQQLSPVRRPGLDFERGPALADPTSAAWCSFCCRPDKEVGQLVASPTGAFVCAACVAEAQRLLDVGHGR